VSFEKKLSHITLLIEEDIQLSFVQINPNFTLSIEGIVTPMGPN
jgi:hypothetical protein